MTQSPARSISYTDTGDPCSENTIPVEIITDEEMALIEAAFHATASTGLISAHRSLGSIRPITALSQRGLSACTTTRSRDIEDLAWEAESNSPEKEKKNGGLESYLQRFRNGRGLAVTDLTGTEWCEKLMEYSLTLGKPEQTEAMKAGSARHLVLEEEVSQKVKVNIESAEDAWALKFMNFIIGVNQLLFGGLTREIPLVGVVKGVWMVGIIDEVRMPLSGSKRVPILVDTKTRFRATRPSEPQRRNGRLQLMLYKYMWDGLVTDKFPSGRFFDYFSLNPNHTLSQDIRESAIKSGLHSETLVDMVRYFENSCSSLPLSDDKLLLRYEYQKDQSVLEENEFSYDSDWLNDQMGSCLEFWHGKREPSYPPIEERWKCRFCKFASQCPTNASPETSIMTNR